MQNNHNFKFTIGGTPLIRPPSGHGNLVVLMGWGQIVVQNGFKLHSTTVHVYL